MLRMYIRAINTHPWKTQCASTGVLMCVGDGFAQMLVEKKPLAQFDWKRSSRFFLFGTFIAGPTLRTWYITLDKIAKGTPKVAAMKKMAMDQLLFAPVFISFFLTSMTFFATGSMTTATEKCRHNFLEVLITNWKIWPAAQILNFYFVPLNWRLIFANVIAVFWNTYLAHISERHSEERVAENPVD